MRKTKKCPTPSGTSLVESKTQSTKWPTDAIWDLRCPFLICASYIPARGNFFQVSYTALFFLPFLLTSQPKHLSLTSTILCSGIKDRGQFSRLYLPSRISCFCRCHSRCWGGLEMCPASFHYCIFFSIHVYVGDDEGRTMQQPGDHRCAFQMCVLKVCVCVHHAVCCAGMIVMSFAGGKINKGRRKSYEWFDFELARWRNDKILRSVKLIAMGCEIYWRWKCNTPY